MNAPAVMPAPVAAVFDTHAPAHRAALLKTRALIFAVARQDPRIGEIEETLRWGEPAYITQKARTGSTIRLGVEKTSDMPAVFFNCKTTLVEDMRARFGNRLRYAKNRAVLIEDASAEVDAALQIGIAAALTYHLKD